MPKKFIIKDEDGKQFEITEETTDEEVKTETEDEEVKPEVKDDEGLTPDEVAALKELAKHSGDLIKLLEVEKKEHEATSDEDIDETVDSDEEMIDSDEDETKDCDMTEDEDETVIETKTGDSKKSVGSIAKKTKKVSDSLDNREMEIADAWAKRYGKSYKKGE